SFLKTIRAGETDTANDRSTASPALDQSPNLLRGTVRSVGRTALEGVTVSARAEGETITTTVFTDDTGVFVFPPLRKARYHVWAQAVGFQTNRARVDMSRRADVPQNFTLAAAVDPSRQMSGADWMA